jgi:hypothetical protein
VITHQGPKERLAVPEGAAANNRFNSLKCQPTLIDPKQINGSNSGVSTRGDPPPQMQTPPGKGGAAEGHTNNQVTLNTAAPSIPQGGAL